MKRQVGKWGVPGMNENSESSVDVCAERGRLLVLGDFSAEDDAKIITRVRDMVNEEQKYWLIT